MHGPCEQPYLVPRDLHRIHHDELHSSASLHLYHSCPLKEALKTSLKAQETISFRGPKEVIHSRIWGMRCVNLARYWGENLTLRS